MAYIYELEYKIHSVIDNLDESGLSDGDPEINIMTQCGFFKVSEDSSLISYAESTDGGRVLTDITQAEGEVRLSRRGAVVFDTVFREGELSEGLYSIPPYSFDATVRTRKIRGGITKEGGELSIIYDMTVGGQAKAVRLKISAKPKARA